MPCHPWRLALPYVLPVADGAIGAAIARGSAQGILTAAAAGCHRQHHHPQYNLPACVDRLAQLFCRLHLPEQRRTSELAHQFQGE